MRLVLAHGKNGIAHVSTDGRSGAVYIHDGAVVHAATGELSGTEAFYELALWKHGRFDFQGTDAGAQKTILTSTRSLLVEASRRFDASSRVCAAAVSSSPASSQPQCTSVSSTTPAHRAPPIHKSEALKNGAARSRRSAWPRM